MIMGGKSVFSFYIHVFLFWEIFSHVGVKHSILDPAPFPGELIAHSYFFSCTQDISSQSALAFDACTLRFVTKEKYRYKK